MTAPAEFDAEAWIRDFTRTTQAAAAVVKRILGAYVSTIKATLAQPALQRAVRHHQDLEFIRAEARRHVRELEADLDARMDAMYDRLGLERIQ